jgi:hypothetical protein
MQKRLRLVNQQDGWIARNYCGDYSSEGFDAVTCLIDWKRGRVETYCIVMNSSLLYDGTGSTRRQPYAKVAEVGWVNDEIHVKGVMNDPSYFSASGVIPKERLETAMRWPLQIASRLVIN